MYSIVGLGNPGSRYALTPHNVGFMVCDLLSFSFNFSFNSNSRIKGYVGKFNYNSNKIAVLKPATYMNLSGESVSAFINFYKLEIDKMIVVHDDIDMELGKIKIKKNSSSGGHKGVESIINILGTQDFTRIKIGVGRGNGDAASHVLSLLSNTEKESIRKAVETAEYAALDIISSGLQYAMNRYNSKTALPIEES